MDNFLEQFNDINTEQTFVQNEVEKHKALAILAYIQAQRDSVSDIVICLG